MPDTIDQKFIDLERLGRYNNNIQDWVDGKVVELTKAQYDALPSSKYTDDIHYFLTDAYSGGDGTVSWVNVTNKPITNTVTDSTDIPTAAAVKTYVDANARDLRIDSTITRIGVNPTTGTLEFTFVVDE